MKTNVRQLLVDTSKSKDYELDFRIKGILIKKIIGDSEDETAEDMHAKISSNSFTGILIPHSFTSSFGRQNFAEFPDGIIAENRDKITFHVEPNSELPAKLGIIYEVLN